MIRKIVIGRDPKDAMAYFLGMRAGTGKVSAIVEDDSYLHKYNKKRYLIYIENDEGTMVWKTVDDMPCIVEYDIRFE
jgi:hypothetical protein|tara:strand:+ start:2841 stop:3071 length:231 start_codon:yes stop_codon:yes gene_type:complete